MVDSLGYTAHKGAKPESVSGNRGRLHSQPEKCIV
jgi:hypothetical protein